AAGPQTALQAEARTVVIEGDGVGGIGLQLDRIGAGLGGGSGWVVLGFNQHTRQLENYWMADHAHAPAATSPILVMDMYEHAYQMDFGAATARYIDAFFVNVNWDEVNRRLDRAQRASAILRGLPG
ncbi:MAG TPA: Fe-Mn family superoxide dismutase, partial [Polyangiaceae bacterium]|nr:Fe-Mn family superoxide dismutase [Polyangiaceae bacterium]